MIYTRFSNPVKPEKPAGPFKSGRGIFMSVMLIIVLAGWFAAAKCQNDAPRGFLDINFGTSKKAVILALKEHYKMKQSFPIAEWPMNGCGMDLMRTSENILCLTNYVINEKKYTVLFFFNSQDRFFGFRFKGTEGMVGAFPNVAYGALPVKGKSGMTSQDAAVLLEEALFLSKVFEKKFGAPTKVIEYRIENLMDNGERVFWMQKNDSYFSAIGSICIGRTNDGTQTYSLIANVYDYKLKEKITDDFSTPITRQDSLLIKQESKLIEKAAESF
jgi:hypothetical protein